MQNKEETACSLGAEELTRPELVPGKGYVYIIEACLGENIYKVGITHHLERRMRELRPRKILSTVKVPNPRALEAEIQSIFESKRLPGTEYLVLEEWEVFQIVQRMEAGNRIEEPESLDGVVLAAEWKQKCSELGQLEEKWGLEDSVIEKALLDRKIKCAELEQDKVYRLILQQAQSGRPEALELLAEDADEFLSRHPTFPACNPYREDLENITRSFDSPI